MTPSPHISLPNAGECPFCSFLAGEKPYTVLWRRELTAAFVTREQRGVPHALVIPTRHVETILDLADDEASALIADVRELARLIDNAYRRPGIVVWQNNGSAANQAVPHVHFHVAGTLDDGGTEFGHVPKLSVVETDAIAQRLLDARHAPGSEEGPGRVRYQIT